MENNFYIFATAGYHKARLICRPGYPVVHRTPNGATGTQSSIQPVRLDTRFGFGSTGWCSYRVLLNDPLELLQRIKRLFRCSAGHPDPANRACL